MFFVISAGAARAKIVVARAFHLAKPWVGTSWHLGSFGGHCCALHMAGDIVVAMPVREAAYWSRRRSLIECEGKFDADGFAQPHLLRRKGNE